MAVESPVGIQAVEPSNLGKIESFLNSTEYREIIEGSSTYNHRLCSERRMRIPWLDSQTGVAQNHSALLMAKRQRMPPLAAGQIYTYPRARWRKKRRQYLIINSRMLSRATDMLDGEGDLHSISQLENPSLHDTDSKDSQLLKDEKDWYFDDQEMLDIDGYDEPDADSDFDYEEDYRRRTKRRRGGKTRGVDSPSTPRRGKGGGRGRKKQIHNFDPVPGDSDKPFACDLCSARYKTRPGLTYHYTHSHRDPPNSDENSRDSPSLRVHTPVQIPSPQPGQSGSGSSNSASMLPATLPTGPQSSIPASFAGATPAPASFAGKGLAPQTTNAQTFGVATQSGGLQADSSAQLAPTNTQSTTSSVYQDSYVTFLNHPAGTPGRRGRQPNTPGMPQTPGSSTQTPPSLPPNPPPQSQSAAPDDPPMPVLVPERKVEAGSSVTPAASTSSETKEGSPDNSTASAEPASSSAVEKEATTETTSKDKAAPSPYCDFCLGDAKENKKTGTSEELVSCSDCGRSGHPTCLQFTPNMIISVRKYRWQCIECKCCSICGTSDNDDQLLFCDDCDRGYHMYCLSPPLSSPPEGFWSCTLCLVEFHK